MDSLRNGLSEAYLPKKRSFSVQSVQLHMESESLSTLPNEFHNDLVGTRENEKIHRNSQSAIPSILPPKACQSSREKSHDEEKSQSSDFETEVFIIFFFLSVVCA